MRARNWPLLLVVTLCLTLITSSLVRPDLPFSTPAMAAIPGDLFTATTIPAPPPASDTPTDPPATSNTPASTVTSVTTPTGTPTTVPLDTATATDVPSTTSTATSLPGDTVTPTSILVSTSTPTDTPQPTAAATSTYTPTTTATYTPGPTSTATKIPAGQPYPAPSYGGAVPATNIPASTYTATAVDISTPWPTLTQTATSTPLPVTIGSVQVTDTDTPVSTDPTGRATQVMGKPEPTTIRAVHAANRSAAAPPRSSFAAATAPAPVLTITLAAPALLGVADFRYTPQPFIVKATLRNQGKGQIQNVRLTLALPKGLSLASGTTTQVVGNVRAGTGRQVLWRIMASRQVYRTTLTYAVQATALNARAQVAHARIILPAIFIVLKAPILTVSPLKLWGGDQLAVTIKTVPGASLVAAICCVRGSQRPGGTVRDIIGNGDLWTEAPPRISTAPTPGVFRTWPCLWIARFGYR